MNRGVKMRCFTAILTALVGVSACGGSASEATTETTPSAPVRATPETRPELFAGTLPESRDVAPRRGASPSAPSTPGSDDADDDVLTNPSTARAPEPTAPVEPEFTPEPPQDAQAVWGTPDSESGAALPERRPMSGAARSAYREGLAAAAAGNNATAQQAFERALSADAAAYKAAYNLGVIADRSGQDGRAMDYYRQALRIQPDYERAAEGIVAIFLRRNSATEALGFVEPLARQWVRNLAIQALYAEVLVEVDRLDDAVNAARAALRRDERFVPALLAIVKANLKRNRTELAESILDRALAVDPNNAEAHFLKGKSFQAVGRLGEALTEFRRAVELRPDYAEARVALGIQFLAAGNYAEAVDQFERTAALLPGAAQVHLNLGDAYRATSQWTKAKASFDRSIQLQERLPQAHFNLALMYMAAGDQFPGMDKLASLQRSVQEFNLYRDQMGPQIPRGDASQTYLEELARQIDREQKRIERDRARAQRDAERAARGQAAPAAPTP
jgi:tetratricopeptide (TPR) repeat protein